MSKINPTALPVRHNMKECQHALFEYDPIAKQWYCCECGANQKDTELASLYEE
jgi:hypothetical protein